MWINYFDNILDAMVYEVYFEEELKSANKDFIKHLSSLKELGSDIKQNEIITKDAFKILYSNDNLVRKNLYYLDSVEVIKTIKESLSKQNLTSSDLNGEEDNEY